MVTCGFCKEKKDVQHVRFCSAKFYAVRDRRCIVCHRRLTDSTSVELGVGPVCRKVAS